MFSDETRFVTQKLNQSQEKNLNQIYDYKNYKISHLANGNEKSLRCSLQPARYLVDPILLKPCGFWSTSDPHW